MRARILVPAIALLMSGCSAGWEQPASKPETAMSKRAAVAALHIPPGHYPPPGMCRVWVPGRPPGHQARPVSCAAAIRNVPPGAWILHRSKGKKDPLEVTFYDERRPGIVVDVQFYDPATGVLIEGRTVSRR